MSAHEELHAAIVRARQDEHPAFATSVNARIIAEWDELQADHAATLATLDAAREANRVMYTDLLTALTSDDRTALRTKYGVNA